MKLLFLESLSWIRFLNGTLGINTGNLPVRYLGVPLVNGILSESDYAPLVDKRITKVNSWGINHLSFAGRLQLVQVVLQGIVNYWCLHFFLPKKFIKLVEQKCVAFL